LSRNAHFEIFIFEAYKNLSNVNSNYECPPKGIVRGVSQRNGRDPSMSYKDLIKFASINPLSAKAKMNGCVGKLLHTKNSCEKSYSYLQDKESKFLDRH
jgi:hypothetical protein